MLCGFFFLYYNAFSQNIEKYVLDISQAIEKYNKVLYDPNGFLFGKEYKLYHYGLETSPMFNASLGMEGKVFADGETYPATLAYDIYQDKLILLTEIFPEYNFIELNEAVIDSFSLMLKPSSKSPINLRSEKEYMFKKTHFPNNVGLKDGFYEMASNGDTKIYIHHEAVQGNNEGEEAIIHGIFRYDYKQDKILFLNGTYYEINLKRKFVSLFPSQKKAINKKLRSYSTPFDQLSATQLLETIKALNTN